MPRENGEYENGEISRERERFDRNEPWYRVGSVYYDENEIIIKDEDYSEDINETRC